MDFLQILWHLKGTSVGQWAVDSVETETGTKKVCPGAVLPRAVIWSRAGQSHQSLTDR